MKCSLGYGIGFWLELLDMILLNSIHAQLQLPVLKNKNIFPIFKIITFHSKH
jgi:hypothetical protein